MFAEFTKLRHRVAASLGLAPAATAMVAMVAGASMPLLDERLQVQQDAWYVFDGGAQSARAMLSTISSSIIALTALVFSITVLVLQLASSQYSPRIIGNFLRERSTKLTLSVFVGTFVYSMVVLVQLRSGLEKGVPNVSVWMAFALLVLSVFVFIHYIDRMTHSVRVINIITRIAAQTLEVQAALHPSEAPANAEPPPSPPKPPARTVLVQGSRSGVLVAVDLELHLDGRCRVVSQRKHSDD
jgi:uncharacterized membrane protein